MATNIPKLTENEPQGFTRLEPTPDAVALTADNYYKHDTDFQYLSFSVFKDFEQCEAATLAKLKDDYKPKSSPIPLLVGNYVHSYFESQRSHQQFIAENHKEIISQSGSTKGQPKAPFKQANKMIKTLSNSQLFQDVYMPGNKEVIVTGKIEGLNWKGKTDSLNLKEGYFCDLKTVDLIHKGHFNSDERAWENFVINRKYEMQMMIYQELIHQTFGIWCEPFIFAVSKQNVPDKVALKFESDEMHDRMNEDVELIKRDEHHIWEVMMGEVKPKRCEQCEYCRLTKELTDFIDVADLEVD